MSPRVAVIGGSLTGPTAALALQARGFDVNVYEATPRAVTLAGGVIGLQHPALTALEAVGIEQGEITPINSEQVIQIRVKNRDVAGQSVRIFPGRNTTWTLLNAALKRRLDPARYHTNGKRLKEVRASDSGPAMLIFADGDDATADLVVFADGRKSFGRKLLDPGRKLTYAGYVAHRGMVQGGLPDLVDAFYSFQPEHSLFNTFPAMMEDGQFKLDWTFFLDSGPDQFARLFGDTPTRRTFVFPRQVSPEAFEFVNTEARRRLPRAEARAVHDTTERMAAPIVDIDPPTQMVWPLGKARAVLVGDALGPPRPHTGQGANRGIDQVADLAMALYQHTRWGADLDTALGAWEGRQLPVVQQYLVAGRKIGQQLQLGLT